MSAHRILLVEDSREVQIVVCTSLKKKYLIQVASTCREAMAELESKNYSLVILDIELPDGDGFKICAQLKLLDRHRNTPVIFLSGKKQVTDKVMGLSLGADDFIEKPFDPLEFQARVEARIRNVDGLRQNQENFCIGVFRIIPAQQKVSFMQDTIEKEIEFTTMEFKLFYYLIRNENLILSREQILNEVWGHLANVTDRTVDTHIYTIRQKLGIYAGCIQAVPRAGYRYAQTETRAAG